MLNRDWIKETYFDKVRKKKKIERNKELIGK